MFVAKTPSLEASFLPYRVGKEKFASFSAKFYFSLESGTLLEPVEALQKICKSDDSAVVDEGMPKIRGEFTCACSFAGAEKNYLLSMKVDDISKDVLVMVPDAEKHSAAELAAKGLIKVYSRGNAHSSKGLPTDISYIGPADARRTVYFGKSISDEAYALPLDFNFEYFMTAPADQTKEQGRFEEGTEYFLGGFGSDGKSFSGKLPKIGLKLSSLIKKDDSYGLIEAPVAIDTIRFFVDAGIGVAISRGVFRMDSTDPMCFAAVCAHDLGERDASGNLQPVSNEQIVALVMAEEDALKKKSERKPPEFAIQEKVVQARKETKTAKRKRYAAIYADYMNFAEGFMVIPSLMGDRRDYLTAEDQAAFNKVGENAKAVFGNREELGFFDALANKELFPDEKNFHARINSFLWHLDIKGNSAKELLARDKDSLIPAKFYEQYHILWNDEPVECSYQDWGIDKKGTFTIPAGAVVPCIAGPKFISATVFPNGPFDSTDAFVVPGSDPGNYPFWFNGTNESGLPYLVCHDVWDALLLATEMNHLATIVCMPEPSSKLPSVIAENAADSGAIVPCLAKDAEKIEKEWGEPAGFMFCVPAPFGLDAGGKEIMSLRERLTCELPTFDWLGEFMPNDCVDPVPVPLQLIEAQLDKTLQDNLGVVPFSPNADLAAIDKLTDEHKAKVMKYLARKADREAAEKLIENARALAKKSARESPMELMARYQDANRKAINSALEASKQCAKSVSKENLMTEDKAKILLDNVDEIGAQFAKDFNAAEEQLKQSKAAAKKLIESVKEQSDGTSADMGFAVSDLVKNRKQKKFDIEGVSVRDDDWSYADASKFKFKDCTFHKVYFSKTDLTESVFDNCSFTECVFVECHMPHASWSSNTFLAVRFVKNHIGETAIKNCDFNKCQLISASFQGAALSDTTFCLCEMSECAFDKTSFKETQFEFSNMKNLSFTNCVLDAFRVANSELDGIALAQQNGGEKISITDSKLKSCNFDNTAFANIGISSCEISSSKASMSHWKNVAFDAVNWNCGEFKRGIWENVYAENCVMQESDMQFSVMKKSTFKGCDLRKTNFLHANLYASDFSGSRLGGINFNEANLYSADFSDTYMFSNSFENAILDCTLLARRDS